MRSEMATFMDNPSFVEWDDNIYRVSYTSEEIVFEVWEDGQFIPADVPGATLLWEGKTVDDPRKTG